MKPLLKNLDFVTVIKYGFLLFSFLIFANIENSILPYSASIFVCALACGTAIVPTFLIYIFSYICLGAFGLLASQAIFAFLLSIIIFIYRRNNVKIGAGVSLFCAVCMLSFIFLGDTSIFYPIEKRIFTTLLTALISFISVIALKAVTKKGLKFKFSYEEYVCAGALFAIFGLGVCNFISPYFWRVICAFTILFVCYLCKTGIGTIVSCVLGISFAIYYSDLTYVSVLLLLSIATESLKPLSRHLSAVSLVMADYLAQLIFGVYGSYGVADFLTLLIGALIFCIIPEKTISSLKERLYSFRERHLVRQTINRQRQKISSRLFEVSTVFSEMATAFDTFKKNAVTEDGAKSLIERQVFSSLCLECEHRMRCKRYESTIKTSLNKVIDIGFAKGKLSLIDIPQDLSNVCLRPNDILYATNKLLADYRAYALENANYNSGRELIAVQASGVSEMLNGLALETGTQLKYQNRLERNLCSTLFKNGFIVSEVLIYGEKERLTVNLIALMNEIPLQNMQKIVSKTVGQNMILCERTEILGDKYFLSFKKATEYDAVYGLARAVKDGSSASGDTHAVTRIEGDRLLIALSDGMGSGEKAQTISSTALSLIESFYKAGLTSELILNTVNKLLSINTEDSYTALDLSVVDLKTCSADFIKYGSPYGFIVGEQGIRIVEGNTLPLGIINELKPSVCSAELNDGDIILLLSDGVSDAFSSSGEIIDFLRSIPAKNPQTLADQILITALRKNNHEKKDDMTALAVRVFKRKSA